MPTDNNQEPTLNDLLSAEDFQDQLYADAPRTIGRVLQAQERHLTERFEQHQQHQSAQAQIDKQWDTFWKRNPALAIEKAEVKDFAWNYFKKNPDIAQTEDFDTGMEQLAEAAEQHLKLRRRERVEEEEASVMRGSPDDPVEAGEVGQTDYSLTSMIRSRRSGRRAG